MDDQKLILVAEDDPVINRLIAFKLQRAGYRVITAVDGRAALDMALNENIDAALLDVLMPFIDGITVLKQIRENKPYLPVIMVSVKSLKRDIALALKEGATDYITKPFQPDNLLDRLNKALGDN